MDNLIQEAGVQRTFSQIFNIWVTPEIQRRKEAGKLQTPVNLIAAQIIFYPDDRKNDVRLNSEVRGCGKMKLKSAIEKKKGDPVYAHELEGIDGFRLSESDDLDCGHITVFRINEAWIMFFDCIYNKTLSERHICVADQFLKTAEHAFQNQLWSPFVDSLFSAAELCAKSILLNFYSDAKFREKANHRSIQSRFNRWASFGNADISHASALNHLSQLRGSARYLSGELSIECNQAEKWLKSIKEMRDFALNKARVDVEW